MRAAISQLVLLLAMCGAQTRSAQTEVQTESQGTGAAAAAEVSTQLDFSAELKELRDIVQKQESNSVTMRDELKTVLERLVFSESKVVALERVNAAQQAELVAVKTRVSATETELESQEKQVNETPRVSFSGALATSSSGCINAGNSDMRLVFSRVITNVGQAYDTESGFFIAPVRGVYYFRFTAYNRQDPGKLLTIRMYKNGQHVVYLSDVDGTYLSTGVTLEMEKGEDIILMLTAHSQICCSPHNESTFTAFMVFPL
ncbi:heavy metal-binding protein HIP-like [Engraulis encrasicolus]|uniref:heavy metal-binding protein HIP-like n=1 Tax=Engraulis encrasicolus TaxID=184585 RepID=UPI002FD28098